MGLNTKLHLAVDAHGIPVRVIITEGTTEDCTQACHLIQGINAEYLLANKGYDSNEIIEQAKSQGMQAVISPRKNRKGAREYDKDLYKHRHLVENAFLHLKRWRGVATLSKYLKKNKLFAMAEWYHPDLRNIVIYFDSWKDLQQKFSELDYQAVHNKTL